MKKINPNILHDERFPRSNKYDPVWIFNNEGGPHPLWLAEYLSLSFDFKPGMRVLDLACGRGITSAFLAREFGVQVYAVDFDEWEGFCTPELRWENAAKNGVEDLVIPIKADARALPFAYSFFDAVFCVNSFYYFGLEDSFLEYILKFLRPNGKIGMIINGYMKEITDGVPAHILDFLGDEELWTWKSLPWYRNHWEKTGLVTIDTANVMPDGNDLLIKYELASNEYYNIAPEDSEVDIYIKDNGEYMAFIRMVGTKT